MEFESDWMLQLIQKLKRKNEEICMELSYNIEKNAQTFEKVIDNLHTLVTSMKKKRENFDFFINVFEHDFVDLNEMGKERVLKILREEMNKSRGNL